MKKRKFWDATTPVMLLCAALLLFTGVTFFLNIAVFFVQLSVTAVLFAAVGWRLIHVRRDMRRMLSTIADSLDMNAKASLEKSPLPVMVISDNGEILWYSQKFQKEILDNDKFGQPVSSVVGSVSIDELKTGVVDVDIKDKRYTVYVSRLTQTGEIYLLYFVENTRLKKISEEYTLSRPAVVLFYIDNMDELLQNTRSSERAQISSRVESMLEDWVSSTTGVLRRFASDRFILVVEHRHLQQMIINRFNILDKIRGVQTDANQSVTMSIGVGQGTSLRESEQYARQAIDMSLGRGGDQAAVKTKDGYDFYGGVSQGVERRTKVRTRVIASALSELIAGSDKVLVMGHRASDLDCLGSSAAIAMSIRNSGKFSCVVVNKSQTLAPELIERYTDLGYGDIFIKPEEAEELMTQKSLLIITDVHIPKMLECEDIYRIAKSTVVIDHHRKMVGHIDDAVIFYHEPFASSTCEMVAELFQYLDDVKLSRIDAESLLAGIMLDTRNFVFNAGVRTFEAAAYLRRVGADTVEVKRLFAGSMGLYKEKADIVANAEIYRRVAIAHNELNNAPLSRIAASQAANELLYIKGVDASFVIYKDGTSVSISARSMGGFNVQLVMEAMGGGGHLTMAGAQLADTTPEQAGTILRQTIDTYLNEREQSRSTAQPV